MKRKRAESDDGHGPMFSSHGDGKWWRTDFPRQCPERVTVAGRCQGVEGHAGNHWCYAGHGSYCYVVNRKGKKLKPWDAAAGMTPPGHKKYVHPEKVQKLFYLANAKRSRVTDPKEIARLERGDLRDNESCTRPVTDEKELKRLKAKYPKRKERAK
jgi:hypothetical protein